MLFLSNNYISIRLVTRGKRGSVMPFIAVSMVFFMTTLGVCVDLLGDYKATNELEFAAQQAALNGHAYSGQSQAAVINQIVSTPQGAPVGANGLNNAEAGPTNSEKQVLFQAGDIQFVPNPLSASEFFTEVTARRTGPTSLRQYFWPIGYTTLKANATPENQITVTSAQSVLAYSQIATRIGPGAPYTAQAGTLAANFIHTGAVPIAVSSQQYSLALQRAQANAANNLCTLYFPSSTNSQLPGGNNVVKACFVNLSGSTASTTFYNGASGLTAIGQLISQINYFIKTQNLGSPPVQVEIGSQLSAFDPASTTFKQQQPLIIAAMQKWTASAISPNSLFAIPVLANDPSFNGANNVVGFALMHFTGIISGTTPGQPIAATFTLAPSMPIVNASCGTGVYSIPPLSGQTMIQVAPFLPRVFDPASLSVPAIGAGYVLAPAVAPTPYIFRQPS